MMLRKMLVGIVAALTFLVGCEPFNAVQESTLNSDDTAALRELILSDPLYTSDAEVLNDGELPQLQIILSKSATPIIPIRWGRRIASIERDVVFDQVNDTTVIATVTHNWTGTFFIVAHYSVSDTTKTIIQKPFSEQTERKIKFYRVTAAERAIADTAVRRGWRPAEVSASKGGTQNSLVTITKLEIISGDRTIEITEPLEYFFELPSMARHSMRPMIFNPGIQQTLIVRATVMSADPDTDWVSLHRPLHSAAPNRPDRIVPIHERMHLVSETPSGSNFVRVFEAAWGSLAPGRHAFFVTAVTRSTIFDDQAPVSTQIWGVPYITE